MKQSVSKEMNSLNIIPTFRIVSDILKYFLEKEIVSERKMLLFTSFLGLLKKNLEIKVGWVILEKL